MTRAAFIIVVVALFAALVASCTSRFVEPARAIEIAGDPQRGRAIVERDGCGACHAIAGVREARGELGPPLDQFSRRSFIAGTLPNTEKNLVRWLRDPPSIQPHTAMPSLDLDEQDARDVAAFLLRQE